METRHCTNSYRLALVRRRNAAGVSRFNIWGEIERVGFDQEQRCQEPEQTKGRLRRSSDSIASWPIWRSGPVEEMTVLVVVGLSVLARRTEASSISTLVHRTYTSPAYVDSKTCFGRTPCPPKKNEDTALAISTSSSIAQDVKGPQPSIPSLSKRLSSTLDDFMTRVHGGFDVERAASGITSRFDA
jgi:hypothetical protein